ncbi:MAG TPA: hypothetical protein ENN68_02410 [Methanomicrobia archaeon]|nr:hypothetical protein [Methanomicrobia archaeon]
MSLVRFARQRDDILKPYGQIDVLLLYAIVAEKIGPYLAGREIASRIWLPGKGGGRPYIIKRGSKDEPLYVNELADAVTPEFLKLREEEKKLSRAEEELTPVQRKVWHYFVPRKLVNFFYATNTEDPSGDIDRVFLDLDRGQGVTAAQAQAATVMLLELIRSDDELMDLTGGKWPFTYWTGNSFHVILRLKDAQPHSFYDKKFKYSTSDPEGSFTGRWAKQLTKNVDCEVAGGHEKKENRLNIDPSQTPPGKLCRVPLGSIHVSDPETIDGFSIPVTNRMLKRKNLTETLVHLQAKDILSEINKLAARVPEPG